MVARFCLVPMSGSIRPVVCLRLHVICEVVVQPLRRPNQQFVVDVWHGEIYLPRSLPDAVGIGSLNRVPSEPRLFDLRFEI